jgi:hypothetical protein
MPSNVNNSTDSATPMDIDSEEDLRALMDLPAVPAPRQIQPVVDLTSRASTSSGPLAPQNSVPAPAFMLAQWSHFAATALQARQDAASAPVLSQVAGLPGTLSENAAAKNPEAFRIAAHETWRAAQPGGRADVNAGPHLWRTNSPSGEPRHSALRFTSVADRRTHSMSRHLLDEAGKALERQEINQLEREQRLTRADNIFSRPRPGNQVFEVNTLDIARHLTAESLGALLKTRSAYSRGTYAAHMVRALPQEEQARFFQSPGMRPLVIRSLFHPSFSREMHMVHCALLVPYAPMQATAPWPSSRPQLFDNCMRYLREEATRSPTATQWPSITKSEAVTMCWPLLDEAQRRRAQPGGNPQADQDFEFIAQTVLNSGCAAQAASRRDLHDHCIAYLREGKASPQVAAEMAWCLLEPTEEALASGLAAPTRDDDIKFLLSVALDERLDPVMRAIGNARAMPLAPMGPGDGRSVTAQDCFDQALGALESQLLSPSQQHEMLDAVIDSLHWFPQRDLSGPWKDRCARLLDVAEQQHDDPAANLDAGRQGRLLSNMLELLNLMEEHVFEDGDQVKAWSDRLARVIDKSANFLLSSTRPQDDLHGAGPATEDLQWRSNLLPELLSIVPYRQEAYVTTDDDPLNSAASWTKRFGDIGRAARAHLQSCTSWDLPADTALLKKFLKCPLPGAKKENFQWLLGQIDPAYPTPTKALYEQRGPVAALCLDALRDHDPVEEGALDQDTATDLMVFASRSFRDIAVSDEERAALASKAQAILSRWEVLGNKLLTPVAWELAEQMVYCANMANGQ